MLSRPVQLIPTSEHYHSHIRNDPYPMNMQFGSSSCPTTNENPLTPLNVQVPSQQHLYATKNFDSTYIQMQLLPSTTNTESLNSSQQSVQFTFPTTHLHSSSILSSTTQRSMDHNNNDQLITTPIIHEVQTDEKLNDLTTSKNLHKNSSKNRSRLPLQPSTQQTSTISASSSMATTIRQPKKHKLIEEFVSIFFFLST